MFEEKINEIFGRVNKEIQNLKTDSSKTLSIFAELLTEIAQELAELKKDTVALKTSYEIGFITKKDEREEQIRLLLSKGDNTVKITDAELKRYAEKAMLDDYREYKIKEGEREYLETMYDAYIRQYYAIKADRSDGLQESKFYN